MPAGKPSTCMVHGHHAWPRLEWHHGELIAGSTIVETWSSLRGNGHRAMAYTRLHENPEGEAGKGCSSKESIYGSAHINGEEAPVRGRSSGRGGPRSGRGGAPWRRGTRSGDQEQPKEAAACGLLTD
jgi:hypothetical protein